MIVIIPARGGSRRIPRKNIKAFLGKPIIAYSIELAKQVSNRVIVTTDDPVIRKVAEEFGAETVERPPELARDEIGTQEVVDHTLKNLGVQGLSDVCALYATAPLLTPEDIRRAWLAHSRDPDMTCRYSTNPYGDPSGGFYIAWADFFDARLDPYQHGFAWPTADIDINDEGDWKMAEKLYEEIFG